MVLSLRFFNLCFVFCSDDEDDDVRPLSTEVCACVCVESMCVSVQEVRKIVSECVL